MTDGSSTQAEGVAVPFFDRYPRFYGTAKVSSEPNRLQQRYRVLIEGNREAIEGKRVLDIASHDGRWSFAALMNGAHHAHGIEGRPELVAYMRSIFDEYGIGRERYSVQTGDVLAVLPTIEPGTVDTVFLFGFLYHTMHPMRVLNEIARIGPAQVILDTNVAARAQRAIILLSEEDPSDPGRAVAEEGSSTTALVGLPSPSALRLLLDHAGYDFEYCDWKQSGIADWTDLPDYRNGARVTLRATPRTMTAGPSSNQPAEPPKPARLSLTRRILRRGPRRS